MKQLPVGKRVRVRVPATSANLGPGFDTLGIALAIHDELEFETLEAGKLEFDITGVGADSVPQTEEHLVIRALKYSLEQLGYAMPGIRMHADNIIPHGRGMGSSGAAIVAGVVAAAGLVAPERTVTSDELLALATDLEGHPDNVAPCLFGGLTIAWMDAENQPRSKQLMVDRGVSVLVLVPEERMSTEVARSLQPEQVPHADAIFNLSRSALLIAALTQSPDVLFDATEDRLHQTYRASAMPQTAELVRVLRDAGFAAVVSGAGPSVLVLCQDPGARLRAAELAKTQNATWQALMTAVDVQGATVETVAETVESPRA
ncbi:homoserine kinase [Gulosibacter bifidus]|uniref:Homoserine kinase n=1 Tax=Gulosibacter bifidus TaxID=272239 RepID=A0ABW5RHT1_9MICO|nr:homoserine kinase [Gulosibacter bifidus]